MAELSHSDPNRVHWEQLDPGTYEELVAVLISRLHPSAQRIDGSGGDGGRDVQLRTGDGLVLYELKSFTDRMTSARRQQVKSSLRRAAQLDPVKWSLVVPIDPTPSELEWFESLTEVHGFECEWLGQTWLDSQLAQMPEIATYYAHDQRFRLSELVSMLRSVNASIPPVDHQFFGAAAEQMRNAIDEVNRLDPHYVYALSIETDGTESVSVLPRYPGAESDRPWSTVKFEFGDDQAGRDALRTLRESLDYGTRGVVPAEFITELKIDFPAGEGTSLEGYELILGSAEPNEPADVEVVLLAVERLTGAVTRLPLTQPKVTSGLRGARVTMQDISGAVTATLKFDMRSRRFHMDWHCRLPDKFNPLELLPASKFAAAIERGACVEVIINGEKLASDDQAPPQTDTESDGMETQFAQFLEDLVMVQSHTGAFFDIRDEVTVEEADAIASARRLLDGDSVESTWQDMRLVVRPGGREPVTAALGEAAGASDVRIASNLTVTVQGVEIRIGRVTRTMESVQIPPTANP